MDVKLDSLIEKIKKEGIEEAQQTSEEMIKEAKQKSATIIEQAKKDAQKIIEDGKHQVEQFKSNAEADLKQTVRNAELLLKERINKLFDNVFKKEVAVAMSPEFLKELLLKIVASWTQNTKAEIVVNDQDKDKLESLLFSSLKDNLKDSITFKVSNEVARGFRIGIKDEQVYYDFSDDAVADVLKSLLNPKLKEILDK